VFVSVIVNLVDLLFVVSWLIVWWLVGSYVDLLMVCGLWWDFVIELFIYFV